MSDYICGLILGDNPKVFPKESDPGPPEDFVDNTVKVYKLNPDGSKGEHLRDMPAFPEGWNDPANLKRIPGQLQRKPKEGEDNMAHPRANREEKLQQAKELMAEGKNMNQAAIALGVPVGTLGS